jgi:hypothetical protein
MRSDRDTIVRRIAMTGVVVSATVLSYSTLHHRALAIGIPGWSSWFYPVLYDAFILGASRMWQNHALTDATRKLAKRATVGGIVAAVAAFIIEFAPRGWFAVLGALMIPAVMATALVLTSRAAADRKAAAEKAQDEAEETPLPLVPLPAPKPVAKQPEPVTEHVAVVPGMARGPKTVAPEETVVVDVPMDLVEPGVQANAESVAVKVPTTTISEVKFDPTDKRAWINAQLDAGVELTGAMVDKQFGGRNGARTLKSVLAERAPRNGHKVMT